MRFYLSMERKIPVGICVSTTQLAFLLTAEPPGPPPLTNCSDKSFSLILGTLE